MKIHGEHFFDAPRERVWGTIVDPRILFAELPGFQRLDPIGDHEYEGALEVEVADVRSDFQGTVMLSDIRSPASYRFSLSGLGAAGFVDGDGFVVLEESGGGTRILYDLDVKIGGRIATLAERELDRAALDLATRALERLGRHFRTPAPESVASKPAPDIPALSVANEEPDDAKLPAGTESAGSDKTEGSAAAAAPTATSTPASSNEPAEPPTEPAGRNPAPTQAAPPPSANAPSFGVPEPPPEAVTTAALATPPRYGSHQAKGLVGRLLKPSARLWVFGIALVLYTLGIIVLTRACSS